mmetsp:Transcript_25442/g.70918  ORF Transcript_25442/g.70918 Transcript_25442/m.70918 type:complete len:233 (-) Transcript_25442:2906-3604(-)
MAKIGGREATTWTCMTTRSCESLRPHRRQAHDKCPRGARDGKNGPGRAVDDLMETRQDVVQRRRDADDEDDDRHVEREPDAEVTIGARHLQERNCARKERAAENHDAKHHEELHETVMAEVTRERALPKVGKQARCWRQCQDEGHQSQSPERNIPQPSKQEVNADFWNCRLRPQGAETRPRHEPGTQERRLPAAEHGHPERESYDVPSDAGLKTAWCNAGEPPQRWRPCPVA